MNDNDIEQRLQQLLGSAPIVPAPEGLRRAVIEARTAAGDTTTATDRTAADEVRTAPRVRLIAWRGRRGRTAFALAGLAATFVLAAGLLTIVANRPSPSTQPGASPSGPIERIDWQVGHLPGAPSSGEGIAAFLNGKIMYFGTNVWSLDEASGSWAQLTTSNPFDSNELGPGWIHSVVEDGSGGLVAYGDAEKNFGQRTAMVWRSTDGRTWTPTQLGAGSVDLVIAAPNGLVAMGTPASNYDCLTPPTEPTILWRLGGDGKWTTSSMPEAFLALGAVLVHGQIVVWGDRECVGPFSTVPPDFRSFWSSGDGVGWRRLAATGLPSTGYLMLEVVPFGDRLAAYDAQSGARSPLISSVDLETWQAATLPAAAGVDTTVIAAFADQGQIVVIGRGNTVWTSSDGMSWQVLPDSSWGPDVTPILTRAYLSGDQVLLPGATLSDGSMGYLLGTIVRK
jgi:hypothetical protein